MLLGIIINAETFLLGQLAAPGGGGNTYDQVLLLLAMALVFLISWKLVKEMPGIALALTGGHYSGTATAAGTWIQSQAVALIGRAGRAAGKAIAAPANTITVGRPAPMRPPGQSLSSGP